MKSLKPILICAAIVLVVVLALVIFTFVIPKDTTTDEPAANTDPTISTTDAAIYIIDKNYEELTSIEFLPKDGQSFQIDISLGDDGNYSFDVTPATPYFSYDASMLRSLLYSVSRVSAKGEITDNVEPLSSYGLDDPWYTVRCTYSDGTVTELYFGNQTVVDKNYYCKTNLSDSVYVVGNYTVQLLTRDEMEYRDTTLFTTYEGEEIYDKINWYRLTLRNGTEIEVSLDSDGEDPTNSISSLYVMHAPYEGSVNDEIFRSTIADVVAPIKKVEIIGDVTVEDLPEYGLDHPARLEMTDIYGDSLNLLIGSPCENSLYSYAMIDGTYTVLVVESACLTWLEVNPIELFIRLGWICNITEVSELDLEFRTERFASQYDGLEERYEILMTHGERVNSSGNTVNTVTATMNGEELSEVNCRRLYLRTLNMRIIDLLPEGTDLSAEPDAVFTLKKLDGTSSVMELIPINERDYAMVIDGKATYFIYQKNLNSVVQGLKEIAQGYELDVQYSAY